MITKFERLERKAQRQITQKTLDDILNTYKRVTGSKTEKYISLEEFKVAINNNGSYTTGTESRWRSKLKMRIDDVGGCSFELDTPLLDMDKKSEIANAMKEFSDEANGYLGICQATK